MKKKMISLLLCFSMVVACAACGAEEESGEEKAASKDKITLEFYQTKREAVKSMDALIKKFNESQDRIVVEQNNVPDGQDLLMTRMASNDMPPIFTCYPGKEDFKKMTEQGAVVELTSESFLDNVLDGMKDIVTYDDKIYALPISASTLGIYVNKDLFAELGETEYPETYDELLALYQKAEDNGITGTVLPYKSAENVEQLFQGGITSFMDDPISFYGDVESGKVKSMDNEEYVNELENLLKLNDYAQDDFLGTSYDQAIAEFANGNALSLITGLWALPSLKEANPDINCELIPFPGPTKEQTRAMVGIDCSLAVATNEDEEIQDAAMEFIRFIGEPENVAEFNGLDKNIPTLKDVPFDVPEVTAINECIASGNDARFSVDFWPAGVEGDLRAIYQEFVATGDVKATTEKVDQTFTSRAR